ncbi:hypothetical protein ISS08_02175 [Candidatus Pacearchaeota archaeon]|nr:hypothetical protein [Candidatus Pacearchaeota archaeon]
MDGKINNLLKVYFKSKGILEVPEEIRNQFENISHTRLVTILRESDSTVGSISLEKINPVTKSVVFTDFGGRGTYSFENLGLKIENERYTLK